MSSSEKQKPEENNLKSTIGNIPLKQQIHLENHKELMQETEVHFQEQPKEIQPLQSLMMQTMMTSLQPLNHGWLAKKVKQNWK